MSVSSVGDWNVPIVITMAVETILAIQAVSFMMTVHAMVTGFDLSVFMVKVTLIVAIMVSNFMESCSSGMKERADDGKNKRSPRKITRLVSPIRTLPRQIRRLISRRVAVFRTGRSTHRPREYRNSNERANE